MPNWVMTNANVSGSGPDLQKFLDRFRDPDGDVEFKFEKIIPMPEDLNEYESNYAETGAIYVWLTEHSGELPPAGLLRAKCKYKTFAEFCEERRIHFEKAGEAAQRQMLKEGRNALNSCIKYGAFSWHDWCVNNWGTKWDVNDETYVLGPLDPDAEAGSVCLNFQTAWSFPAPIFVELSKLYPELTFEGEYADEDYGSNCAEFKARDGKIELNDRDGDRAFAYNVWGEDPDDEDEYLDGDDDEK